MSPTGLQPGLILAAALMSTGAAQADRLYKCTNADGRTTYSQIRCGQDGDKIEIAVDRPTESQVRQAQRNGAEAIAIVEEIDRQRSIQRALEWEEMQRAAVEREERAKAASAARSERAGRGRNDRVVVVPSGGAPPPHPPKHPSGRRGESNVPPPPPPPPRP